MIKGLITKLIGGLYTVRDESKISHKLKARGKFRHTNESPVVGDRVIFDDKFITEILERKNILNRPPLANIDQAIIINSCLEPDFSFNLLDRFLLLIEHESITPIIVVTKTDLMNEEQLIKLKNKIKYYKKYYHVIYTSTVTLEGTDEFKELFRDKISIFAGQTGAGKSSLLNVLDIKLNLKTDKISKALGRGKHTTRHSEMYELFGGLVADTPGFSKLDFFDIKEEDVPDCFIDFFELSSECKYRGCKHLDEPKCNVKKELELGNILQERYYDYKLIMEEIRTTKPMYRK
ncbi:MAG: ribosome small subunit-dependent GTPase A [Candidatus Izimaplasma sp.]|nr:ribosome small subunit-dependent GTPase A [Candidatus Izimaplasma bacterium]